MIIISKYIPEFDWYLMVEVTKDELLGAVKQGFFSSLIFGMLITLIIIAVNIFSINYIIIKPFQKIQKAIVEFSNGNLDTKIDIKQNDEIGQLAIELTSMGDRLSSIVKSIHDSSDTILQVSREITSSSQSLASECEPGSYQRRGNIVFDGADACEPESEFRERTSDGGDCKCSKQEHRGYARYYQQQ